MPKTSEAMLKAINKYQKEKVDEIKVRVSKGQKEIIKNHASKNNESVNGFINRAIDEAMERDRQQTAADMDKDSNPFRYAVVGLKSVEDNRTADEEAPAVESAAESAEEPTPAAADKPAEATVPAAEPTIEPTPTETCK